MGDAAAGPGDLPHDPRDLAHRFAAAWNGNDADALAALFAEDADFVNVVGLWWRRRKDIRKAHDYALKSFFRDAQMTLEEVKVRRFEQTAVVHCLWRLEGARNPDGSVGEARRGVLVIVARSTPEGWQAVTAQNTDIVPGTETMMAEDGRVTAVRHHPMRTTDT